MFYPTCKVLKGGEVAAPGKKVLESWFLSCTALRWDVTCDRQERMLGLAGEGDRDLVLLSCFLLPGAICPYHLLVAEALAACSRFPHAPVCASISAWQSPLVAAAQGKTHAVGTWFTALTAAGALGAGCWPCSPRCVAGTGPKATPLCTFVRWAFDTIKFSE